MDQGMNWSRFKAEAKSLKLYSYWRSSASWRVRWALHLKNIPFEIVPVNLLKAENKSPEHLKKSPLGAVPVLEINGEFFLSGSLPMIEWIEEVYQLKGPSLFPGLPIERAHIRSLCEIIGSDTAPLQVPSVQKRHSSDSKEQSAWAYDFIDRGLDAYEKASRFCRGQFSFGDQVTAADLFLVPQIYNALRYQVNVEKDYPELWKIYKNSLATETCVKASPERQIDAPKD